MRALLPRHRLSRLAALAFALGACAGGSGAQAPAGTSACKGTPKVTRDPGYRLLFDGTQASFTRWAHAGPGHFALRGDCTLESAGGLGLLWYDDEQFESPMTLKVEWMIPGDANSGVFVGFPAVGNEPFVAPVPGDLWPGETPDEFTGGEQCEERLRSRSARKRHPKGAFRCKSRRRHPLGHMARQRQRVRRSRRFHLVARRWLRRHTNLKRQ